MASSIRWQSAWWTVVVPVLAVVVLAAAWQRELPAAAVAALTAFLVGAVLAAVHHAEVVAHRVGEPYGSLVLAVAVTVIEVALIVTLMISGGGETESLARDTVFAAVMITCNGIVGLSILVGTLKGTVVSFNAEGTGGALATVATLATLCLVLPTFTTSTPGPQFSPAQLAFAAVTALALYALFVAVQVGRHRDYFLPVAIEGADGDNDQHAEPPSNRTALLSVGLLLVALVAVVGDAKLVSPTIERAVATAGLSQSVVGVVVALLVLLPETLAAVRAAGRNRIQISLNLAFGSAMASIGLTIPTIAVASIWLPVPLHLGLGATHIVLLALTCIVSVLTVVPGRATLLQAAVHLALFAAYLFLAVSPQNRWSRDSGVPVARQKPGEVPTLHRGRGQYGRIRPNTPPSRSAARRALDRQLRSIVRYLSTFFGQCSGPAVVRNLYTFRPVRSPD